MKAKNIKYKKLPFFPVHSDKFMEDIPKGIPAIYFLVSESRGLFYIGLAADLRQRWHGFHYDPHSCLEVALYYKDCRLHYLETEREKQRSLEKELIQIHKPICNDGGVTNYYGECEPIQEYLDLKRKKNDDWVKSRRHIWTAAIRAMEEEDNEYRRQRDIIKEQANE